MKKVVLGIYVVMSACFTQAQTVRELLTAKSWVFDSVYTIENKALSAKQQHFYKGLFRAAQYDFTNTGKYTFERPGVPQVVGKWELEDKNQFLFLQSDSGRGKRYKILEIKENRLILEDLSSKTAIAYKAEDN